MSTSCPCARLVPILVHVIVSFVLLAFYSAPHPAFAETIVPDTVEDVVSPSDGQCSLREAISAANGNVPSGGVTGECPAGDDADGYDAITLTPSEVYTLTIAGAGEDGNASGDLDVTSNVLIEGESAAISSGTADRVLQVLSGTVTLSYVNIWNGHFGPSGGNGGGIYNHGNLTLDSCFVTDNVAWGAGFGKGGGIYNDEQLFLIGTNVNNNSAGDSGGGIHNQGGTVTVSDFSMIETNTAAGLGGGGIASISGTVAISNFSFVSSNEAISTSASSGLGGGIFIQAGSLDVLDASFVQENVAHGGGGGGIYNTGSGTAVISGGSMIYGNIAPNTTDAHAGNGGGIFNTGNSRLDVIDASMVFSNIAYGQGESSNGGGGIYNVLSSTVTVEGSMLTYNAATANGGAFFTDGIARIEDSMVFANLSHDGAGIFNRGTAVITTTYFDTNESSGDGGAIYSSGSLTLTESTLFSNTAWTGDGGGVYISPQTGAAAIQRTTVHSNYAGLDGGGIAIVLTSTGQVVAITNTTLSGNLAGEHGGGIYAGGFADLGLYNVTVAGNAADAASSAGLGGGIYAAGDSLALNNTLVGDNRVWIAATTNADCYAVGGSLSVNNSLVENDGPSGNGCLEGGGSGNVSSQDAQLGPLQDNGGATETHALLDGSPAIDAGRAADAPAIDQRGVARPRGQVVDIGAFELSSVPPIRIPVVLKDM